MEKTGIMEIIINVLLILGIAQMVVNLVRYMEFLRGMKDVLTSGSGKRIHIWKKVALFLITFFLIGYIGIFLMQKADLLMACIMFGGAVFVSIMIFIVLRIIGLVKERSIDVAEVLIGVIDARDPNLDGHSRHVQNLTMLFFEYIPAHLKRDINSVSLEYAALMHDVGKLGVPESILNKPAKLTDQEWVKMRKHPEIGVKILSPLTSFKNIMPWILYHHERVDGKGYYGLSDSEIPLPAKIIAIADTYSAITMRRSYKNPRTHEEAIRIIQEVAGTQLDKQLADIFCGIPKEQLIKATPVAVKSEWYKN
jgi:HD-GYP domain-containing protein (c-di-GMP phosphodiesterase class II)